MARKPAQQAPSYDLNMLIEQLVKDKGIDRKVLVGALESAMQAAAKKAFGQDKEIEAKFNGETGVVDLFQYMLVVDEVTTPDKEIPMARVREAEIDAEVGDSLGFQLFYREGDEARAKEQDATYKRVLGLETFSNNFGRIAAQMAKQVIAQKLRDAERDIVFNEYKDRKGELVAGIVRRFERGNNVIVDLGRAEAVLSGKEQIPKESFRVGDRIQAYIKDVDREAKGLQIILSRADTGFLRKLFEQEVPEIAEGIVRIQSVVREPGMRAKVAVASRDLDVDPVGACVGMKGARVQAIVQELRGEKIDIVPWDKDPARYVCNAISPAEVSKVIIDEPNGSMELIVPDEKLSLAIGKKGQNVRLATQLTGWRLDIMSESVFKKMEEETIVQFTRLPRIDGPLAGTMYKLGFRTMEDLVDAELRELAAIPGLGGSEVATAIKQAAAEAIEQRRRERILEANQKAEPLTQRERMLFISGIGERTVELLMQQGYATVEDIVVEDIDKFAIRTGLGLKKAKVIIAGARQFQASEKVILDELEAKNAGGAGDAAAAGGECGGAQEAAGAAPAGEPGEGEGPAKPKGKPRGKAKIDDLDEGW